MVAVLRAAMRVAKEVVGVASAASAVVVVTVVGLRVDEVMAAADAEDMRGRFQGKGSTWRMPLSAGSRGLAHTSSMLSVPRDQ
jgi:hypothetical protein